jgi:ribosomal protein S18 acetylase RimI-like enzyme
MSAPVIRDAIEPDLDAIARLHMAAFPDSVLGEMGAEAVRRNYLWQLTGPHDLIALVATDGADDRVLGYLFGGVFRGSTIGFVKSQRWFLVGRLLRNPRILLRGVGWSRLGLAARLLVRRRPSAPVPEKPETVPRSSLGVLAIAVDPAAQGRGVGRALMDRVAELATAQGFTAMHLTVHPSNAGGLAFYRALGWTELPEDDGRWVGRMTFPLSAG